MDFIKEENIDFAELSSGDSGDDLFGLNMNKTTSDFLSNEWSSNPNDLLDSFFNGDFFNDLIEPANIIFNDDYGTGQQPVSSTNTIPKAESVSPVPSSEPEFHGFLEDENVDEKKFDISEYVNCESTKPSPSSSPASDSGLSSDNMEVDISPDYEPLSPTLSSPGPSISERGGQNSPPRCVSQLNTSPNQISVVVRKSPATPQVIIGKVQPMPKLQTQPMKAKTNLLQKKEVKIIKMAPATQFTGITGNGQHKKVTIRIPSEKMVKAPPGTIILNKSNTTTVPEIRKLVRVQSASNPRSILLPVSFQDVKDFRTIKIINASNLNNKSPNIKLAAANLLQQSKQGLVQKNVLVPKEKLMVDDSISDYTSDAESNVYEDVMMQSDSIITDETDHHHSDSSDSVHGSSSYPKLMLTSEEKRLLAKEGIILPGNYPLTKHEERELKRIRRKIRNKISAQDSRKRKKEYVDGLEERVKQCTDENQTLMKRIKMLQNQNHNLMNQMKKLQAMLTKGTNKTAQPATCLMVLLLSLALVTVPNLKLGQNAKETELSDALQEGLSQNRRALLFNNKEQLGDALVDEEMNLDDIVAFNEMNEEEILDGVNGNGVSYSKKPKSFIDLDVDDTNWRGKDKHTNGFNKKANEFQEYLRSLTNNAGYSSSNNNHNNNNFKNNIKNDNGLKQDILNLLAQQSSNLFDINLDAKTSATFGEIDIAKTTATPHNLIIDNIAAVERNKLNESQLNAAASAAAGERKILLKGV